MLDTVYEIYQIRDRYTGEIHERETRRQGHKLKLGHLRIGEIMIWDYLDGTGYVRTSTVKSFSSSEDGNLFTVTTRNTNYTFKRHEENRTMEVFK